MAFKITDYPAKTVFNDGDLYDVSTFDGVSYTSEKMTFLELKTQLNSDLSFATTDTNTQLSDSEVETAYNNQVDAGTDTEITTGTETEIRRWSPIELFEAITDLNTNFSNADLTFDGSYTHDLDGNFMSIGSDAEGFADIFVVRGDLGVGTVDVNGETRHSGFYTYIDTGDPVAVPSAIDPMQLHQEHIGGIGRLTFEGNTGGLLTIIDDKDNELWTASDVSGNPIGYIDADWTVRFGNPFDVPFEMTYETGFGETTMTLNANFLFVKQIVSFTDLATAQASLGAGSDEVFINLAQGNALCVA